MIIKTIPVINFDGSDMVPLETVKELLQDNYILKQKIHELQHESQTYSVGIEVMPRTLSEWLADKAGQDITVVEGYDGKGRAMGLYHHESNQVYVTGMVED